MATELFSVVALPHSVAAGAEYHVSLFVSPRLTPNGAEGKLKTFKHFPHWAQILGSHATIELFDQLGPIVVKPRLDDLDPKLWDAIFPANTPVRGPQNVDFSDRHWRTFRAGEVHDAAKVLHLAAIFSDPTSPPAPSVHPLTRLMGQMGVGSTGHGEYDESRVTEMLDRLIGETGEPGQVAIPLRRLESIVDNQDNPLMRLAMQVHRARRFYERPESKRPIPRASGPGRDRRSAAAAGARLPRALHARRRPPGSPASARARCRPGGGRPVAPRGQPLALGPDRAERG